MKGSATNVYRKDVDFGTNRSFKRLLRENKSGHSQSISVSSEIMKRTDDGEADRDLGDVAAKTSSSAPLRSGVTIRDSA